MIRELRYDHETVRHLRALYAHSHACDQSAGVTLTSSLTRMDYEISKVSGLLPVRSRRPCELQHLSPRQLETGQKVRVHVRCRRLDRDRDIKRRGGREV